MNSYKPYDADDSKSGKHRKKLPSETDERFENEFASEVAAPLIKGIREVTGTTSKTLGWTALITAFASLFIWPGVLGPVAAIVGIVAYVQGTRALGIWSVVIGLISLVSYLFLVPYYA